MGVFCRESLQNLLFCTVPDKLHKFRFCDRASVTSVFPLFLGGEYKQLGDSQGRVDTARQSPLQVLNSIRPRKWRAGSAATPTPKPA